jgi:hypothetical protein
MKAFPVTRWLRVRMCDYYQKNSCSRDILFV